MSDQIRRLNSVSKPQLWQLSDQRVSPKNPFVHDKEAKVRFYSHWMLCDILWQKKSFSVQTRRYSAQWPLTSSLPNVTHDMSIANHKIWSDMLTWNTWRQLPQIKLPCEFWTELNSKSLQWTQTWRNCHHTGNISAQIHTKMQTCISDPPHAKTKACIKTNTHVCNYPRKHISRWEGGGKGRGLPTEILHVTCMPLPASHLCFGTTLHEKKALLPLTNISFPTHFVSKTAHHAQPRKTCWQTPILISTKWKKQGKDATTIGYELATYSNVPGPKQVQTMHVKSKTP